MAFYVVSAQSVLEHQTSDNLQSSLMIEQLFFELICVAIGSSNNLSHTPSAHNWGELYKMAKKQSLVGFCFAGIQKLVDSEHEDYCGMNEMLYLTWMGMAAKIQQKNEQMNVRTEETLDYFRAKGFHCQVLKGQGIAALYEYGGSNGSKGSNGSSLRNLRQSGDVDVWINSSRKELYELSLKEIGKLEGLTYHHIHYPIFEDCEIEAHTWPSFLTNPLMNNRFQKFCSQYTPTSDSQDTPSLAFNRVFILQHCYGHFCGHGVGMRQLLDYYFVLIKSYENENQNENYKSESLQWISALGMKRFAEATMWVMKEIFGLDDKYLLCEPNEKDGRFLLAEVMETGNMGHLDERVDRKQLQSAGGRYLHNLKRDWKVARIAPSYALWEPLWGIFQFAFCKYMNLKYK